LYAALPQVPVVLFSDVEDAEEVVAAFRAGINSFIPASIEPELVPQTLTFIMGGGSYFPPSALLELRREPSPGDGTGAAGDDAHPINGLSPADIDLQGARPGQLTSRQLDVLALLRQGKSNKMIARDLGMREATVKVHVRQILRKLGASNRTQAALSILESSIEAPSLGGGGGDGGEIKAVALPGFRSGEMKVEKAGLFTKGTVIGRQLLVGGLAGAISLIEGDLLEMMAVAPSYIAHLT
jgi:DNA-binding NarL/FixJ family response regulator